MTVRKLMLGGAAGIMLVATPVLAQSIYTHEPTPEERVQTNNLNTEAADQAKSDSDAFIQARDGKLRIGCEYLLEFFQSLLKELLVHIGTAEIIQAGGFDRIRF